MPSKYRKFLLHGLILGILLLLVPDLVAQDDVPLTRTYHKISMSYNNTATDFNWIQLWEQVNPNTGTRELTMIEAKSSREGVNDTCYYLSIEPDKIPVYIVDENRQLVSSGDVAWQNLQNRRIFDQYMQFVDNLTCDNGSASNFNGVDVQSCTVTDLDTPPLFLLRPPTKASGDFAVDSSGTLVQYNFTLNTDTATASSTYRSYVTNVPTYEVSPQDSLECLSEYKDTNGNLLAGNLSLPDDLALMSIVEPDYAIFDTDSDFDNIISHYQSLPYGWNSTIDQSDQSVYLTRVEDQCQVIVQYNKGEGAIPATVSYEIRPPYLQTQSLLVEADNADTSETFTQSATNATVTEVGTPDDAIDKYINRYLAQDWSLNEELTDRRADSAFVTLERGNYQLHIIAEAGAGRTFLRFQTRSVSCGSTFDVNN